MAYHAGGSRGRWISPWGLACTGACLEAVLALRRLAEAACPRAEGDENLAKSPRMACFSGGRMCWVQGNGVAVGMQVDDWWQLSLTRLSTSCSLFLGWLGL